MEARKTLPTLLLAAAACGAALAQSQTPPETTFEASTGPVTVKSVQPPLANASDYRVKVADIDANGDGVVTPDEVPANHALQFEFRLVDADHNGRISEQELANWK